MLIKNGFLSFWPDNIIAINRILALVYDIQIKPPLICLAIYMSEILAGPMQ